MVPETRFIQEATTENWEENEYRKLKKQDPEHRTRGK